MEPTLTYCKLETSDANNLYQLIDRNRPWLRKFWWERLTRSSDDSRTFITSVNRQEQANGAPTRGVFSEEKLIGVAALHTIDWDRRSTLFGFWLDHAQSGCGYGTAIGKELVRMAFEDLELNEVWIVTNQHNAASRAVAKKLGFALLETVERPLWDAHGDVSVSTAVYGLQNQVCSL